MNKAELALKMIEKVKHEDYPTPCYFNTKFGILHIAKSLTYFTTYEYIYPNDLPDEFQYCSGEYL